MTRAAVLSVLACGVRAMAQDAALPSTGAPLDTSGFRYVRTISGGPEGLATVVLDAAVLSHSADLGDLRIGTSTGLQVPYLVEAEARPLTLPLAPPALLPPDGSGISRYRLELPHDTLPKGRLVLRTPSRVFRREVAVRVLPPGPDRDRAPVEVARAAWAAESPDVPAEALVLELPALAASRIEVALDDGENQRLPLDPPALELPSARLRFVRPAGTSLLYYGHPGLAAPRYDLAMLERAPGARRRDGVVARHRGEHASSARYARQPEEGLLARAGHRNDRALGAHRPAGPARRARARIVTPAQRHAGRGN
ncbi:MAG: hypothetical protein U0166_25770 [Acidobacteriota bacterium]